MDGGSGDAGEAVGGFIEFGNCLIVSEVFSVNPGKGGREKCGQSGPTPLGLGTSAARRERAAATDSSKSSDVLIMEQGRDWIYENQKYGYTAKSSVTEGR